MINKYTRKKGMTLIEAIISVALFSILIIPISGLVMTAMKTSEKAEAKAKSIICRARNIRGNEYL